MGCRVLVRAFSFAWHDLTLPYAVGLDAPENRLRQ